VGAVIHLVSEAAQRGLKWITDTTGIHRDRRQRAIPATARSADRAHLRCGRSGVD